MQNLGFWWKTRFSGYFKGKTGKMWLKFYAKNILNLNFLEKGTLLSTFSEMIEKWWIFDFSCFLN